MLQAAVGDGLSFDPFSFCQDDRPASEVDVGGSEIVDALVVARVVVIGDEGLDLGLKIARGGSTRLSPSPRRLGNRSCNRPMAGADRRCSPAPRGETQARSARRWSTNSPSAFLQLLRSRLRLRPGGAACGAETGPPAPTKELTTISRSIAVRVTVTLRAYSQCAQRGRRDAQAMRDLVHSDVGIRQHGLGGLDVVGEDHGLQRGASPPRSLSKNDLLALKAEQQHEGRQAPSRRVAAQRRR